MKMVRSSWQTLEKLYGQWDRSGKEESRLCVGTVLIWGTFEGLLWKVSEIKMGQLEGKATFF